MRWRRWEGRGLFRVRLVVRGGICKSGEGEAGGFDPKQIWIRGKIALEAAGVIELRYETDIGEGRFVTEAKLFSLWRREYLLFQRRQTQGDPVLGPLIDCGLFLLEFVLEINERPQILQRMDLAGNGKGHGAYGCPVCRILGQ